MWQGVEVLSQQKNGKNQDLTKNNGIEPQELDCHATKHEDITRNGNTPATVVWHDESNSGAIQQSTQWFHWKFQEASSFHAFLMLKATKYMGDPVNQVDRNHMQVFQAKSMLEVTSLPVAVRMENKFAPVVFAYVFLMYQKSTSSERAIHCWWTIGQSVCVFGGCIVYPYCNDAAERSVPERSVPKTSKESDGTARKYIYALQRAILITTTEEVDSMGLQLTHCRLTIRSVDETWWCRGSEDIWTHPIWRSFWAVEHRGATAWQALAPRPLALTPRSRGLSRIPEQKHGKSMEKFGKGDLSEGNTVEHLSIPWKIIEIGMGT